MTVDGHTLEFTYDASGSPLSLTYDGTTYYYALNLQGDVVALLDGAGNAVVSYVYDAWGYDRGCSGSLSGTLGYYNPLRYRGYVYDVETGLYYLQSRYYNGGLGRFNAPDAYASTGQGILGNNMFAYCGNNPVNCVDPTGQFRTELWDAFVQALEHASGYFAAAAGVTQVDSPVLGTADAVGAIMAIGGVLVCATMAIGTTIFAEPATSIFDKEEEKAEAAVITKKSDTPVIFPVNPNDFNPVGLIKIPRAGTKNGSFVSWMDPLTDTEVFRWDENPNRPNGPHYHICGTGHYYPGMIVPEPYATIYFPFR